ncbi:MAG TPA: methyltransferase, FxLD system [Chloroflexia bacterium]|nr:methyltransferase, FxLD system [Chloroflexia bacterium]
MQTNSQLDVEALQSALVDGMRTNGVMRSPAVEAAFRAVPRHLFVPGAPLEDVYRDEFIPIKSENARLLSSSSQPSMMAVMLEQLELAPGHRVLEIGTGSGYNAALMSHIVGESGHVVTVDIEEDLIALARQRLVEAGFGRVEVVCGDGGLGYESGAPYDRVILTVGAWDIAPAWWDQLRPGGLLVMPLSLRGPQKCIAFRREEDRLVSLSARDCGFIGLRGAFAGPDAIIELGEEPGLRMASERAEQVDARLAYRLLTGPHRDLPVGVSVTLGDFFGSLSLWLALREEGACSVFAEGGWLASGLVPALLSSPGSKSVYLATLGLYEAGSLCMLARAPEAGAANHEPDDTLPFELVVQSHAPDDALAMRLIAQIRAWDKQGRPPTERLQVVAYRADAPIPPGEGMVLQKHWTQLVLNHL